MNAQVMQLADLVGQNPTLGVLESFAAHQLGCGVIDNTFGSEPKDFRSES